VQEVLAVLEPLWFTKPKTADRLRGKLQRILDYAEASELRSGPNPARWTKLKALLPDPRKLAQQERRAALAFAEVPSLMKELGRIESISARALEITILCALRNGEVRHARWSEIDLQARVWTIPAARMKARREHRVPLTGQVIAILSSLQRDGDYVFIGAQAGKPIGKSGMMRVLADLRPSVTVHGFRSSFRTWAGETTSFPRELAEMALAHALEGGATEAAYARGDMLERRRDLMAAWANYCLPLAESEQVVALRA
jgi:integrase